jgi:hypothetical protein
MSTRITIDDRAREIVREDLVNPDALERSEKRYENLFAPEARRQYPYRDPERLRAAWQDSASVREVAAQLDAGESTVAKWLAAFGLRERDERQRVHDIVSKLSPADLGLDDEEGSA